jgi:four helix bundle protein
VSVSATIAEGSSRASRADFARFVEIATGSLFEVVSLATVANRQGFLPDAAYREIYAAAAEQVRMLSGLRRSLLG